jgi:hypothetical protein
LWKKQDVHLKTNELIYFLASAKTSAVYPSPSSSSSTPSSTNQKSHNNAPTLDKNKNKPGLPPLRSGRSSGVVAKPRSGRRLDAGDSPRSSVLTNPTESPIIAPSNDLVSLARPLLVSDPGKPQKVMFLKHFEPDSSTIPSHDQHISINKYTAVDLMGHSSQIPINGALNPEMDGPRSGPASLREDGANTSGDNKPATRIQRENSIQVDNELRKKYDNEDSELHSRINFEKLYLNIEIKIPIYTLNSWKKKIENTLKALENFNAGFSEIIEDLYKKNAHPCHTLKNLLDSKLNFMHKSGFDTSKWFYSLLLEEIGGVTDKALKEIQLRNDQLAKFLKGEEESLSKEKISDLYLNLEINISSQKLKNWKYQFETCFKYLDGLDYWYGVFTYNLKSLFKNQDWARTVFAEFISGSKKKGLLSQIVTLSRMKKELKNYVEDIVNEQQLRNEIFSKVLQQNNNHGGEAAMTSELRSNHPNYYSFSSSSSSSSSPNGRDEKGDEETQSAEKEDEEVKCPRCKEYELSGELRTLSIGCGYNMSELEISEFIPEGNGYYSVGICKSCRSTFLNNFCSWFNKEK